MTLARPIIPGRTYHVNRRCVQQEFLLRPDKETNNIFEYCLAYAAERYGIQVHDYLVMSNHYHLVATDPRGVMPEFLRELHSLLARYLNRHRGRRENLWAAEQANLNHLVELEDVVDKVEYVLRNPIRAGLVERVTDWPGAHSFALPDGRTKVIARPSCCGRRSKVPPSVTLVLSVPPGFQGSFDEWRALIGARVAAFERRASACRRRTNTRVRGIAAVRRDPPSRRPDSRPTLGPQFRPFIAAKRAEARAAAVAMLRDFRRRYAKARDAFRARHRNTLFPPGTFALVRRCAVLVAPA